jgi:hypothetical protein
MENPPARSIRSPAACTAANTSRVRKPSAAPIAACIAAAPTISPGPSPGSWAAIRGIMGSASPAATAALAGPGTSRVENGGATATQAAARTMASRNATSVVVPISTVTSGRLSRGPAAAG